MQRRDGAGLTQAPMRAGTGASTDLMHVTTASCSSLAAPLLREYAIKHLLHLRILTIFSTK